MGSRRLRPRFTDTLLRFSIPAAKYARAGAFQHRPGHIFYGYFVKQFSPQLPRTMAGLFVSRPGIRTRQRARFRRSMYANAQAAAFVHAQPDFGIFARTRGVFQPHRLAVFLWKPRFTAGITAAEQGQTQAGFGRTGRRIQGHAIIPHGANSFRPKQDTANSFYASRRQGVPEC